MFFYELNKYAKYIAVASITNVTVNDDAAVMAAMQPQKKIPLTSNTSRCVIVSPAIALNVSLFDESHFLNLFMCIP